MAAAFAGGIALGHQRFVVLFFSSAVVFCGLLIATLFLLLLGILLAQRNCLRIATAIGLCGWMIAGALAIRLAEQPLPAQHVLSLTAHQMLELQTPLHWRGRLRDEPQRLPWGYGLDIELSQVWFQGRTLPITGGMRLSYGTDEASVPLPELHAGDAVEFTARARLPEIFRDDGAFDRRAYLAQQGVHLVATLRAAQLIERAAPAPVSARFWLARVRARLRNELDSLLSDAPDAAGLLRAMLLGDRSFVDREESLPFQKTGTFHVLVVAGLHVSALAFFLYACGRVFRLSRGLTSLLTLALLLAYVAVVEQRPPVLRAALMAAVVIFGRMLFRRLDLLNSAAVAALLILAARPQELFDSSFQLSFLAMACIGGLAAPWLDRTVEPYARALRGWRDVTRDAAHEPRPIQLRLDLRLLERWLAARLPAKMAKPAGGGAVALVRVSFRVWEMFVLSLVLQLGMLPMMAGQFHRITMAGPVANLVAVPLTGVLVPLGFLTLGATLVFHGAARVLAWPLAWLTHAMMHAVGWIGDLPHGSYRIPGPPWWASLLFFAAFALVVAALRFAGRRMMRGALAVLLGTAAVIAVYPFAPRYTPGALELTVLDVGQGDAIFVVTPRGKTMLIDAGGARSNFGSRMEEKHSGPDPGEDAVSPYLWSRGFRRLDVVALTHAHQDHIGGMTAILDNFRVGEMWIGREESSPALAALEGQAQAKHVAIVRETRGAKFDWDDVRGEVLWPEAAGGDDGAPQNNDSLVLRLVYGRKAFLLPGDAEKQAEEHILDETSDDSLRADVLKAGHHGSKNSTMPEFLKKVQPRVVIISAGENNPYGHPSPELLERLQQAGVRILRTDQDGAVHALTNGESLEVSCYVSCTETAKLTPSRAAPPASNAPEVPDQEEQPKD